MKNKTNTDFGKQRVTIYMDKLIIFGAGNYGKKHMKNYNIKI